MHGFFTQFAAVCSGVKVNGDQYCTDLAQPAASTANVQNIVQVLFGILAVIAVLIIVISALSIVTADGDAGKVAKARSAILYTLVGLAVAVSADVIVSLIITRL